MILHVMTPEKFLPPFIDFVDQHFGRGEHKYVFITSEKYLYGLTPEHNVEFLHTNEDIFSTLAAYMQESRKIILHGLWRDKIDKLLLSEPLLFEKCYWIMWGGDFYFPENRTQERKQVIRSIAYLVTKNSHDVELVRTLYKAGGFHIECLNYTSNIFSFDRELPESRRSGAGGINIVLGNSSSETNNHFDGFDILKGGGGEGIKIYCPLSYGDASYAQKVIARGEELFGSCFYPITDFMPVDKYVEFLNEMDIILFNHHRQQAFGNIIIALALGKKVYMNKLSNLTVFFKEKGIKVYDTSKFNLDLMEADMAAMNKEKIEMEFSDVALKRDLAKLFSTEPS